MTFNERTYTSDAIIKQLGLIELHCKDGSATEAGCMCIDTKHLYLLEGLAEEGQGFALTNKEKQFYAQLGDLVRQIRKNMEVEQFELHGVMREVMREKHPIPLRSNPRKHLPSGLTACEIKYPSVQKRLKSCIKGVEKQYGCKSPYEACPVNPIAVCRASIACPP